MQKKKECDEVWRRKDCSSGASQRKQMLIYLVNYIVKTNAKRGRGFC